MMLKHTYIGSRHQKGAVLIVSLILLLIMTLVGITAMSGAIQEIKMSSAMQQEEMALRRAERALYIAEIAVEALTTDATPFDFTSSDDAYFLSENKPNVRVADWSGIASLAGPVSSDNGVDDDDALVIEYQGAKAIPGETRRMNSDDAIYGGKVHLFRNTIRSASGRSAVRIVESTYATTNQP